MQYVSVIVYSPLLTKAIRLCCMSTCNRIEICCQFLCHTCQRAPGTTKSRRGEHERLRRVVRGPPQQQPTRAAKRPRPRGNPESWWRRTTPLVASAVPTKCLLSHTRRSQKYTGLYFPPDCAVRPKISIKVNQRLFFYSLSPPPVQKAS